MSDKVIHYCRHCGDTLGGDNPCDCPAASIDVEAEPSTGAVKSRRSPMPTNNQPAKSYITTVLAEADVAKLLDALWKIAVLRQGCKPPKDGGNEIAWEATGIARAALENLENNDGK